MFKTKKYIASFFIILAFALPLLANFDCRLMNQYGGGVANARIKITEAGKSAILDDIYTNQWGEFYTIINQTHNAETKLYPSYPNPNKGSTVLPFYLNAASDVEFDIFNIRGEKVATKFILNMEPGLHQVTWNAFDDKGAKLPLGIYLIRMKTGDYSGTIKSIIIEHNGRIAVPGDISDLIVEFSGVPKFDFHITFSDGRTLLEEDINLFSDIVNMVYTTEIVELPFKAVGEYISVYRDEEYVPIFLKGINLGAATPGTSPGALAATREEYASWIAELASSGLNYLRTYTLHYPRFYEELEKYNLAHPEKPLFLIQGVWLDEEYEGDLYSGQTEKFDADIAEVIDCMYGNKEISHRYGRAYGTFDTDVSPWVLGYIIGREIHPWEVALIEENYPDSNRYNGTCFSIQDTLQLDIWMTARLDHAVLYQRTAYQDERPVSCSSWPTLDPIYHPTEDLPGKDTDEEDESFDMAGIINVNAPAGFFMSYHAYPYYPDFLSEDPGYLTFSDSMGINPYIGYLTDLNAHYEDIPLVIAEFGVPSSWGDAHYSPSGMSHGGLTEAQQGLYDVRMLNNIYDTGCAGGLVFAWIDEWFKNAWITAPFDSEPERRQFWQNVTSPEQNFGLKGYREVYPDFTRWPSVTDIGVLSSVKADMCNAFLYVQIKTANLLASDDTVWVAFDTYRADLGESILPNGLSITNRAEFVLAVNTNTRSPMFVTQAYDLYGIWHRRDNFSDPLQLYHSIATTGAPWDPIRWKNNAGEFAFQEIGLLRTVMNSEPETSMDGVWIDGTTINLRIPWSLLQVTDPSLSHVMNDDRSNNDDDPTEVSDREVATTDGICLTVNYKNSTLITSRFTWPDWNQPENFVEYDKASLQIFINGAAQISERP